MSYGNFPPAVSLERIRDEVVFKEARQLEALALQHLAQPSLVYRGNSGNYDLLMEETVRTSSSEDAPETTFEAWRKALDENRYVTTQNDDERIAQEITTNARSARLEGGYMSQLQDVKSGVLAGSIPGEYGRQTVRFWEDTHSMSSLVLQMSVTHGTDYGQTAPSRFINLSLVRGYGPDGDKEFSQHYRIGRDAATGLLWAGSNAAGITGSDELALVDIGAFLQETSGPELPVNRMLAPQEWMQLVTEPLNPAHKVHL